jgi:hypothetical protein
LSKLYVDNQLKQIFFDEQVLFLVKHEKMSAELKKILADNSN